MSKVIELAKKAGFDLMAESPKLVTFAALVRNAALEEAALEFDRRAVFDDETPSTGWYEPEEPAEILRNLKGPTP